MTTARQAFYPALRAMAALVNEPMLIDRFPPSDPHNLSAAILRRGLTVTAFAQLETYLEDRLEELMADLARGQMAYAQFSDELKRFISLDAVVGLSNRIMYVDKPSRLAVAQAQLARVSGFQNLPPSYTAQGFSPRGSNVSVEDIGGALKALGIATPIWSTLAQTTSALGSSRIGLSDVFKGAAALRHEAAHDASKNVPTSDLQSHIFDMILIAMIFDIDATAAVSHLVAASNQNQLSAVRLSYVHRIRFLDLNVDGSWTERLGNGGRPIKNYINELAARTGAIGRLYPGFIVVRDTQRRPLELL